MTRRIIANQANSKKSSGPTTPNGKRHSSQNAIKHGLFSRHLTLSPEDRADYDALLSRLETELCPTTTLQSLAVEDIARCAWRCTLALRLEARTAEALLAKDTDGAGENSPPPAGWYASSPQELRTARTWLAGVCADFAEEHVIRTEWKPTFDLLFGPMFFDTLSQWQTMDFGAILMAEMLTTKAKTYNMELPGFDEFKKSAEGVIADPRQNEHLKEKILAIQLRHVEDLIRIFQQPAYTANFRTGDFSPRYFTAAQRDLHRAITWFWTVTLTQKKIK